MARRAGRRSRANDVLSRAALLCIFPLLLSVLGLVSVKVGWLAPTSRILLAGAGAAVAVVALGVLHAALRHRPPLEGALVLDRHFGLEGRITNGLAFARVPERERSGLMDAAIEDAIAVSRDLSPRRAVPLRMPRDVGVCAALAVGLALLSVLEVPVRRTLPPPAPHLEAAALSPDDVELFRRLSEETQALAKDPATVTGARRLNQLIEDVAERRLDRREVFRRLDEIERGLADPLGHDAAAADEALSGIAQALGKSALSRPVAEALAERRLEDAEKAMRELAEKVENAKRSVDKAKLEELRKALQKASETVRHDAESEGAERREAEETQKRLLKKKEQQGLTPNEQKELEKAERKLERLDREKRRAEARSRETSGLDRDLAKAAEDLMKDLGQSSQDLERGAEDLNRTARRQLSEREKQELKQRIEELRQLLRQEGQAGKDRIKRMLSFGSRARGGQQGQGQQGQGQQGQGPGNGQGSGQKPGQGLGPGAGSSGQQGSAAVLLPGGSMAGPGGTEPGQSGGGQGKGEEWGQGHDPNVGGDATRLKGQTEDVQATAADTGQGSSTSEVIYGAAERGFRGRGYQKVFTDYQNVAEETLAHDEVPAGYRFYVRRYFQLIRPRD